MNWQPIETAPKDGTVILVCGFGRKGYYVADAVWGSVCDCWMMFDGMSDNYDLESDGHSHWMPLPAPPAAKRDLTNMEAGE
jgi:hypothetical protein